MDNLRKGVIIKGGTCVGFTGRGVIPMTQEEFNALPPEKQLNGSYYITDGTDEIVISDNEISDGKLWSSQKISNEVAEVENKVDGLLDDSLTSETSTWSSSKIASEIGAKVTKTLYRGSRSIDIYTGGKLTLIYSSEYASQAGCYMLLSNFNTVPLLIELGRNDIGQFKVTATHKSENVDTITVTTAGDEYSWYVLQF